jgi:hypothetical protein
MPRGVHAKWQIAESHAKKATCRPVAATQTATEAPEWRVTRSLDVSTKRPETMVDLSRTCSSEQCSFGVKLDPKGRQLGVC